MPPEQTPKKTQAAAGAAKATTPAVTPPPAEAGQAVTLTAAEAAKAVRRLIPKLDEAGQPTGEHDEVAVEADEVQAWAVCGERVIVVTTDGQKLEGAL